jgi:hypothetical protein
MFFFLFLAPCKFAGRRQLFGDISSALKMETVFFSEFMASAEEFTRRRTQIIIIIIIVVVVLTAVSTSNIK